MTDVDSLRRELAEIQDELLALGDDDFAAKFELHSRRDEVREALSGAIDAADDDRPDSVLLAELAARRSQLAELEKQQINTVSQSVGGAAGHNYSPAEAGLNRQIGDAQGLAGVRARVRRLESILSDRGVAYPSS